MNGIKEETIGEKWKSFTKSKLQYDTETLFSSQWTLVDSCEVSARGRWPLYPCTVLVLFSDWFLSRDAIYFSAMPVQSQ